MQRTDSEDDPIRALFQSLDKDKDGELTFEDLRQVLVDFTETQLKEIIQKLDTTGTGSLTYDEFLDGFGMFMGSAAPAPEQTEDDTAAVDTLSSIPMGGLIGIDDIIEEEEEEDMLDLPTQTREDIETLFQNLDTDEDGYIDWEDLRTILPTAATDDLRRLINLMDVNERGQINPDEFYSGFNHIVRFQAKQAKEEEERAAADAAGAPPLAPSASSSSLSVPGDRNKKRPSIIDLVTGDSKFTDVMDQLDEDKSMLYEEAEDDDNEERAKLEINVEHLADKDAQIHQLEEKIRKLQTRTQTAERKYKLLSKVGTTVEEENLKLQDALDEKEEALKWVREQNMELEESNEALRKMVKKLQVREISLASKVKSFEEDEKFNQQLLGDKERRQAELQARLEELKKELQELKAGRSKDNRASYRSKMSQLKGNLELRRMQQMKAKEEKIKELTAKVAEQAEIIEVLRAQIEALKAKIQALEEEIDRLRAHSGGDNLGNIPEMMSDDEDEPMQQPEAPKPKPEEKKTLSAVDKRTAARQMLKGFRKHGTLRNPFNTVVASGGSRSTEDIQDKKRGPRHRHRRNVTFTAKQLLQRSVSAKLTSKNIESYKKDIKAKMKSDLQEKAIKETRASLMEEKRRVNELQTQNANLQKELERFKSMQAEQKQIREQEAERQLKTNKDVILTPEAQTELTAYAKYLNYCLKGDEDLGHLLPLNPDTGDTLVKLKDGWLLAKFLNFTTPHSIDTRALNRAEPNAELDEQAAIENLQLVIESCKGMGIQMTGITPDMLYNVHKNPLAAINCLWRVIKHQLLLNVNVQAHPELLRLLGSGQDSSDLIKMAREELLLLWFNHHLKSAIAKQSVKDVVSKGKTTMVFLEHFGDPRIAKCLSHALLLHQLVPDKCSTDTLQALLNQDEREMRAKKVLGVVSDMGVAPEMVFVTPAMLSTTTETSARLITAFTASLFHKNVGLDEVSQEELKKADLMDDDDGDSREERAFRMWLNSLGVPMGSDMMYINNLFGDCKDGLVLLRVMDHIRPGTVNWKKVELRPRNMFQRVSNCNYVVELAKNKLRLQVVGIGGTDLSEGNKKLTLAIVWQLMHMHISQFLLKLFAGSGSRTTAGGKRASVAEVKEKDAMILKWANERVDQLTTDQKSKAELLQNTAFKVPYQKMASFGDQSLQTSLFFLHLLWAVEPRVVDWKLATPGRNNDEKLLNARYAISVARKLGATIFLLPEDLVEVKSKMITIFVAAILSVDHMKRAALGDITVTDKKK